MDRRPGTFQYPQEPLRHWYLTPLGGHSPDLGLDQVGILAEAIRRNTDLRPGVDRVRIGVLGRRHARPVLIDGVFEVVPLDDQRPDARRKSPDGQAVLPEGVDVVRAQARPPQPGDDLILNVVLGRRGRWGPRPDQIAAILEEFILNRAGRSSPEN